ncbi:hypothetical protein ACXR2U_07990 [Jatrophihabitans sp. YIM 134969]
MAIGGRVGKAVAKRVPVPDNVATAVEDALDKAVSVQHSAVVRYIARAQDKDPAMTPFQLVERLEKRYRSSVIGIGAVSGGAAAAPGLGTAAGLATSVVEIGAFAEATAVFTLARAEVQGITVTDAATRRALVLAVLLGESGVQALQREAGAAAGTSWLGALREGVPKQSMSSINSSLLKHFLGRFAAKQSALIVGRAAPFGIGAVIGGAGNYAVAKGAIAASRKLFGPPPHDFPARVVEIVGHPVDTSKRAPSRR